MKKRLFSLAAVALGMAAVVAADPVRHAGPAIEGTWAVSLTYYYDGTEAGPKDNLQYLQQFDRDGRTVIYLPQQPGLGFDETRTACAGEWKPRGHRTFDVTLYCMWNEVWTDAPVVPDRILIKVTMEPHGNAWRAKPFLYQPFVGGEYNGGPGWGDMRGTRLGIVPLP